MSASTVFFALSLKRYDFRKTFVEYKMCVLFSLLLLSETFPSLRRIQRDIFINVHRSPSKVLVSCTVLFKLEISRQIFEKCPK